jgi:hypothetical protein
LEFGLPVEADGPGEVPVIVGRGVLVDFDEHHAVVIAVLGRPNRGN